MGGWVGGCVGVWVCGCEFTSCTCTFYGTLNLSYLRIREGDTISCRKNMLNWCPRAGNDAAKVSKFSQL